ncbi:hypothetical protein SARC_02557 [Sphaeroforma arctica JP610]|uniref:Uncharacterized protein n=1 Tax=Sphaeroforma arctica JP610 TaxID=667725 RepID=A0A0L0G8Q3_9EUKA|nr:hypothetical protein SARC_02557 [Sphaeroforma arctica JP610]KNC85261.1 hypothetical protein SARC_02557 [Sphaeroforma arctica JP610]|eukprot:XP_014159163.1 hypothetical protein SARC_02557 [Sphaeroforma arctica JP610]
MPSTRKSRREHGLEPEQQVRSASHQRGLKRRVGPSQEVGNGSSGNQRGNADEIFRATQTMLQQALADHQTCLRQGESAAPPSDGFESSPSSTSTRREEVRGQERQNDGSRVQHQQGQTRPRRKRRPYRQHRQNASNAQSKTDQLLKKKQEL